jgi:hypothetical protein
MMNTTPHCVLCGRPEDEAYFVVPPSFSWYLSSVGASRCPECGAPQGVDLVDRAEVERELADLRAEVAALRETLKRVKEATLDYVTFHGPSCEWHYDEPDDSCRACLIDKRMNAACAILEGK